MEPITLTKEKRYAIFNKKNGVLFDIVDDPNIAKGFNTEFFVYKELDLSPTEYYFGDYYDGRVYSVEEKPFIREDEFEERFFEKIQNEYSLIKQIMILVDVLKHNESVVKTDAFNALYNFLRLERIKYDSQLDVIKNDKDSFNFISKEEIAEIMSKRMEGVAV
jgi:hypothetical protein